MRLFLLSPANAGSERAQRLMKEDARFPLALRLREPEGVSLGEAFEFISGLYFRGKLTYARAFTRPPEASALVIVPGAGLVPAETPITRPALRSFSRVPADPKDVRFERPLAKAATLLATELPRAGIVLLGSIASDKYVPILVSALGERLLFPPAFVGRGDMSRGGLLLRCARTKQELEYAPVLNAVRHGPRPPKLAPRQQGR